MAPKLQPFVQTFVILTKRAPYRNRSLCTITGNHMGRSRCGVSSLLLTAPTRSISSSSLIKRRRELSKPTALIAFASVWATLLAAWHFSSTLHAEAPPEQEDDKDQNVKGQEQADGAKKTFRLLEIASHGKDSERPWVIKGTNVYDITDWIAGHPGGSIILRAAGGSVDPYWNIFSIHKKPEVYDILEQFLIGHVDPQDLVGGQVPVNNIEDPYSQDPNRDQRLIVLTEKPMNAESPTSLLSTFITPINIFYVRNHFWVPQLVEREHKLVIELDDGEEKEYTMSDLRENFKQHKITATLQCSGNRRSHMTQSSRPTNGLQWSAGAIGNAEWVGPRLRDVLASAGFNVADPPEGVQHAQFIGAEAYGVSIPLSKAIDPRGDVILAWQMNGKPITPDHGFPLRIIAPGYVAARSVKWVKRIVLSEGESTSQWQRKDYKCFGPNDTEKPNWDMAPSIQETPVQSAITSMHREEGKGEETKDVVIEGYAFSGGGRQIIRVDVSTDDGRTWDQAKIDIDPVNNGCKDWSWKRWKYTVPEKKMVGATVVVKAVDDAYNGQPEQYEPMYNVRGNLTTAWHRVKYDPQKS